MFRIYFGFVSRFGEVSGVRKGQGEVKKGAGDLQARFAHDVVLSTRKSCLFGVKKKMEMFFCSFSHRFRSSLAADLT